jgi:hypothetical protein
MFEYRPEAQAVHSLPPAREPAFVIEPATQVAQSLAAAEPVVPMYLPAIHFVHAATLGAAEYLPIAHLMQLEAALEPVVATYFPTPHAMQSARSSEPTSLLYLPAGHGMQSAAASEPVEATYRPAPQPMHTEACAPEYLPRAQLMHELVEFVMSLAARLVPASQLLQKPLPLES